MAHQFLAAVAYIYIYLGLGVLGEVAPLLDGVHVHGAAHVVEARDAWRTERKKKTRVSWRHEETTQAQGVDKGQRLPHENTVPKNTAPCEVQP